MCEVALDGVRGADLTANVPCGDLNGQPCFLDHVDGPIIIMGISFIITCATWHKYNKIEVYS